MTTHTAATTSTHPPRDRQETVVESSRPATPALPPEGVTLKDVFRLEDIQCIQDAFAEASNVAALITDLQGVPLTRPSHFTAYCQLIRSTKRGLEHCLVSDAAMYRSCREGPVARHCASAGLLDGGTGIYFENQHIANWLVGQVIDPSTDIDGCIAYATDLGIDADVARAALDQVPRMSRERFGAICQALHRFANHLSALAVDNYRQSRLITDLRSAQDSVRERDRNIADIIDFLPDPTVILDQTGTVTFWNRAMEKMTGVAAVDMLGKADFAYGVPFYGTPTPLLVDYARGAIAHPDTRYAVATLDEDAVIAEVEVVALPGGSRHVWAKAVALRDATGSIIGAIETIRDVTDRHRTEMALRESEAMFRRIVETAHEGVWVFDATYKTSFVNRRMAAMLGYTPEEMVGAPLEDFVPGHQMERLRHQQQRRRQGQSDVFELQFATKSGALIWVLISASPLYDASGTFIGALGMFTDITDRKRVEDALANQRQRLEADVEERTRDLQLQALELAEANIRLS